MAAPDFRLIASANSDKSGHFDDIGAIGKTITPEIVIALCGPMGTPLHDVAKTFQELLLGTDYNYEKVNIIRLSDEIRKQKSLTGEKSILKLIEAGNELREEHGTRFWRASPYAELPLNERKHSRLLKKFKSLTFSTLRVRPRLQRSLSAIAT